MAASSEDPLHKYKCQYCDKTFENLSILQRHERVHTGEKPYKCPICGRGFSQQGNVTKHMRTHETAHLRWDRSTESKPFNCSVPGCKKSFTAKGSLTSHLSNCHTADELRNITPSNTGSNDDILSPGEPTTVMQQQHLFSQPKGAKSSAPSYLSAGPVNSFPSPPQPCTHPGCNAIFEHPLKLREHQYHVSPGIVAEHNFLLSTVLQFADMILSWDHKSDLEKETLRMYVAYMRDNSLHLRIPGDQSVPLPASTMPFVTYQNPMDNTLSTHYGHLPVFQTCVEIPKNGEPSMMTGFHAPSYTTSNLYNTNNYSISQQKPSASQKEGQDPSVATPSMSSNKVAFPHNIHLNTISKGHNANFGLNSHHPHIYSGHRHHHNRTHTHSSQSSAVFDNHHQPQSFSNTYASSAISNSQFYQQLSTYPSNMCFPSTTDTSKSGHAQNGNFPGPFMPWSMTMPVQSGNISNNNNNNNEHNNNNDTLSSLAMPVSAYHLQSSASAAVLQSSDLSAKYEEIQNRWMQQLHQQQQHRHHHHKDQQSSFSQITMHVVDQRDSDTNNAPSDNKYDTTKNNHGHHNNTSNNDIQHVNHHSHSHSHAPSDSLSHQNDLPSQRPNPSSLSVSSCYTTNYNTMHATSALPTAISWEEAIFLAHALDQQQQQHPNSAHHTLSEDTGSLPNSARGKKPRRSIVINPCSSAKIFQEKFLSDDLFWLGDAEALFADHHHLPHHPHGSETIVKDMSSSSKSDAHSMSIYVITNNNNNSDSVGDAGVQSTVVDSNEDGNEVLTSTSGVKRQRP